MEYLYLLVLLLAYCMYKIYMKRTMGRCVHATNMSGKTIVITGASRGIGYEVAKNLARRNARLILGCRSHKDCQAAADNIVAETGNRQVIAKILDLSSLASVRQFAASILKDENRLDVLIHNAGISGHPRRMTEDGLEINMATNYFGPFLLTTLLLDLLKKSAPSRVIITTSIAHKWGNIRFDNLNAERSFSQGTVYFDTKLAMVLFTMELSRRLEGTGVVANCLHPGSVRTSLLEKLPLPVWAIMEVIQYLFFRTAKEGAQTTVYLAVAPELEKITGKYFSECRVDTPSKKALDTAVATKLWEISESITSSK